ncbi:RNA-directed DNA polymerase, eukaryota, reverse transcriptase zinc-binding domain protein [Tanacetum coccineum]|uniref:RNA-directed DNA polymerase, eukaryota, reverse transcriptase zinc-binding domain protein n=1 Tax=Tanacetum coccineum TaxID=301880 RepID=A0ABQ4ZDK1_9ASTR
MVVGPWIVDDAPGLKAFKVPNQNLLITRRTVDDKVAPGLLTFKVPGKPAAKKAVGPAVGKKADVPSQKKNVREDVDRAEMTLESRLGSLIQQDTITQLKSVALREPAITSLKEQVRALQELDIPGWSGKNVQVQQQVIEVNCPIKSFTVYLQKFVGPDIKAFSSDAKPAILSAVEAECEKNPFEVASILEKSPVKVGPANSRTQELSYDMSPYQSDDDYEEEDDQPTKKFIPSWCSKSRVAMVLPLQQQIDPVKLFPLQSFCNMDEGRCSIKKNFLPLPPAPEPVAEPEIVAQWTALYDAHTQIACLMLGSMTPELQFDWRKSVNFVKCASATSLREKISLIDIKAEIGPLTSDEVMTRAMSVKELANLEYSKAKDLSNSSYLDQPFSDDEIKDAVWNCGSDKSSGPDGFTFKLFKKYWDVIGGHILSFVKEFETTSSIPRGCNSSFFTLVPKVEDPIVIDFIEDKNKNLFHGVKVGVDKVHVSHLQFVDDAPILGDWSKPNNENLSRILTCFHLASDFKVNFSKSSSLAPVPLNLSSTLLLPLSGVFLLISHVLTWVFPLAPTWQDMQRSLGVYYFSTFKAPKTIINNLEDNGIAFPVASRLMPEVLIPEKTFVGVESRVLIPETTFLVVESRVLNPETTFVGVESRVLIPETTVWDTLVYPSDTLLYRRVSLFTISSPKQGGLGIGSLVVRNQDLLAKWWWRFLIEDNALWCKVIRSIHGSQGGLHDASLIRSKSGPWYRIAKLNEDLLNDYGINLPLIFKKTIGNREFTHFWLGGPALKETFPHIF